jgi:hypothetical protein
MSQANPVWDAPRIHSELLKFGIEVSQTASRNISCALDNRRRNPGGPSWPITPTKFVASDFSVVPTATGRLLFVLVMFAHHRRRVVHVAVTEHPRGGMDGATISRSGRPKNSGRTSVDRVPITQHWLIP